MPVLRRCIRLRLVKTTCLFTFFFFTVIYMMSQESNFDGRNVKAKDRFYSDANSDPHSDPNNGPNSRDSLDNQNLQYQNSELRNRNINLTSQAPRKYKFTAQPEEQNKERVEERVEEERLEEERANEATTRKVLSQQEVASIISKLIVEKDSGPNALGANGAAVQIDVDKLSQEEAKEYYRGWELHGFNLFVSDRISLQRDPPPVPEPECKDIKFLPNLPDTSVIIIFYNEALSTLLRTVYSVINTVPPYLLKEIILIDDFSDYESLREPLEYFIQKHFHKVILKRTNRRRGLIQARLFGIQFTTAETVTFLDAHCECVQGWIEPLLDQVARNYTTVATPIIDQIHYQTFKHNLFSGSTSAVGTFTWMLNFDWLYTTDYEYKRRGSKVAATRSAAMAGGLFTIHSQFFRKLGYYDPDLQLYGAENLELSFKIWMCGGELVQMPCSHVGHVFRQRTPYTENSGSQTTIMRNRMRVAEVWLDDYKKLFYSYVQPPKIDIGDVSGRKALRESLQCDSFESYLIKVAPERHLPLEFLGFGMIRNLEKEEHGLEVCLFANYHKSYDNGVHAPVSMKRCDIYDKYLVFILEADSRKIRIDLNCLHVINTHQLEVTTCSRVTDTWYYDEDLHIKHVDKGLCLEMGDSARQISLVQCQDVPRQRWHWNRQ